MIAEEYDSDRKRRIADLKREAESLFVSPPKLTLQNIPPRIIETVQVGNMEPQTIRRRLQGLVTRGGNYRDVVWYLVDADPQTSLYQATCPFPFCEYAGTLTATTTIDTKGRAVLPFTDPGPMICERCDAEIESRYNAQAAGVEAAKNRPNPALLDPQTDEV